MSLHQVGAVYPAEGLSSSCYRRSNWLCAPLTDLLVWGTFLLKIMNNKRNMKNFNLRRSWSEKVLWQTKDISSLLATNKRVLKAFSWSRVISFKGKQQANYIKGLHPRFLICFAIFCSGMINCSCCKISINVKRALFKTWRPRLKLFCQISNWVSNFCQSLHKYHPSPPVP